MSCFSRGIKFLIKRGNRQLQAPSNTCLYTSLAGNGERHLNAKFGFIGFCLFKCPAFSADIIKKQSAHFIGDIEPHSTSHAPIRRKGNAMKIKSILLPAAAITLVSAFGYYMGSSIQGRNPGRQSKQSAAKMNPAEISEKIRAIEADFERKRQKIEAHYANVFQRLRENVEIELRKLDVADKAAYAHFIQQLNNIEPKSPEYMGEMGRISPYSNVPADESHIGTAKSKPASDYELKVRELNQAANDIISDYKLDCEHYQRQRACALSDLEKQKEWALAEVFDHQSTKPITQKAHGTVTGVISGDGAPLTVINGEVLSVGQSINGVKVIRINHDSVEFEYNGTRWTQKVNEPPSTNWP
jgi:hypothetical protein